MSTPGEPCSEPTKKDFDELKLKYMGMAGTAANHIAEARRQRERADRAEERLALLEESLAQMSEAGEKMTGEEYNELARRTASEKQDNLNHYVLGLTTEVGEIAHLHKAQEVYGKPFEKREMLLELSDLCWYITNIIHLLDSSWEEVWRLNVEKLRERYPDGFTEQAAQAKEKAKGRG